MVDKNLSVQKQQLNDLDNIDTRFINLHYLAPTQSKTSQLDQLLIVKQILKTNHPNIDTKGFLVQQTRVKM